MNSLKITLGEINTCDAQNVRFVAAGSKTTLAGRLPDLDRQHTRCGIFEAVDQRELIAGAVNMAALIYLGIKYGL